MKTGIGHDYFATKAVLESVVNDLANHRALVLQRSTAIQLLELAQRHNVKVHHLTWVTGEQHIERPQCAS